MELSEKDFFEYMKCPVRYQLRRSEFFEEEAKGLKDYLQLTLNNFYTAIKYKKPDFRIMESKWDSIIKSDQSFSSNLNKVLEGKGLLVRTYEYFRGHNIRFMDTNTPYNIEVDGSGIALKGIMNPLIEIDHKTIEILIFDFNKKIAKKEDLEVRTKITLDAYVANKMFNRDIVIRVHNLHNNVDTLLVKGKKDYKRFEDMLRNVNKAISNNIIFPRETYMCNSCHIKYMCKSWTMQEDN